MSEPTSQKKRAPAGPVAVEPIPGPESQRERWVKYGSNVGLVILVVIILGVIVTALAQSQRLRARLDTTLEGSNTLKPQTVSIVKGLDQKVRIIGLYPKARTQTDQDYYSKVAAVLDDYQNQGRNVTTEMIDPVAESGKVDQLIAEVSKRGGGQEKRYAEFLDEFDKKTLPQVDKFANDQYAKFQEAMKLLPHDAEGRTLIDRNLLETILLVQNSVQEMPDSLQEMQKQITKNRGEKIPDYRGAVDAIRKNVRDLSDVLNAVVEQFSAIAKDPSMPTGIKAYAQQNQPEFDATKKACDGVLAKIKDLGDLKALDELRQNLKTKSIVVMTDKDMQVISHESIWRLPENKDPTRPADAEQAARKLRFVGEQAINSAIVSLTETTKPTVAFIRVGGAPLTQQNGPFSVVADRLKQYGFTVLEHDASGMAAAQAQMSGRPPPEDATPEQLKNAVWVVFNMYGTTVPMGGEQMGPGGGSMPNPLGPSLAEHLKTGGSALVLFFRASDPFMGRPAPADPLSAGLKDWGVDVKTDAIVVHERLPRPPGRPSGDMVERARRAPDIFVTNEYGDHSVVTNLNSLDGLLIDASPVQLTPVTGYKSSALVPIPLTPRSWGERDWESVFGDTALAYHDKPSEELQKQIQRAQAGIVQARKDGEDLQNARKAVDDAKAKNSASAAAQAAHQIAALLAPIKQRAQQLKDDAGEVAFDGHPDIQKPGQAVEPAVTAVEAAEKSAQEALAQSDDAAKADDGAKASAAALQVADHAQEAARKELEAVQSLADALGAKAKFGNDIPNEPNARMYAGAAVEKDNGGRLIVFGSSAFAFSNLVSFTDPELEDQDVSVLRFPANGELFSNSVFWLAKKDRMLALSPAAVQVSRIREISPTSLSFMRVFILFGGLPMLALISGAVVYSRRRG